ncbi:cytidylyltransferase domain-containing protein [Thalassospira australica]|uniref:cytidylyltransferase domain-containing protein n=1 Tax=Thalassospira australica TaxID=1528106 RepID=UPI00385174F7
MAIAFIPARGGSKSIPLKNIRPFCSYPLIYWSLRALQDVPDVTQIVVATDSKEITDTVESLCFKNVIVYKRKPENATDTASTESVMLEYLDQAGLSDNELFILTQLTSPLTLAQDFIGALKLRQSSGADSVLTGVQCKRFFWTRDGTSLNYNYLERPRRQDVGGWLMENGAFYINTVGNILQHRNRLSGKIALYEMPEYTAIEIDEEDDWAVAEGLMRTHILPRITHSTAIKLFLSDVDGTLTDAGMYYDQHGNEMKKFNTHDGKGFELLRKAGIKTGLITSEVTAIVECRARKLAVDYIVQGKGYGDKLTAVQDICEREGVTLQEVAYVGDDVNCIDLLKHAGLAACPSNATDPVKALASVLHLKRRGGEGAVREFIDSILAKH